MRPVLARLRGDGPGDGGFTLVEVVVAFVLLGVVMVGATSLIVRSVTTTDSLSDRQTAAALADQALDTARGVKASLLAQGRQQAQISALRAPGTTLVDTSIDDTTSAAAIAATTGTGTTLVLPLATAKVGSTTYTVKTFVEACWLADGVVALGATPEQCGPVAGAGRRLIYRITAEVTWPRIARGCRGPNATTCSYDTSTLRDPSADPVFPATLSAPTLTARVPIGVLPLNQALVMTLTGTNFQQGAYIIENGSGLVGTPVLTALTATFPFTTDGTAGTYQFVLVNPDGGRTNGLDVVVGKTQPTVTSVSVVGAAGTGPCFVNTPCQFTVTGTGFYVGALGSPTAALYPFGNNTSFQVNNVTYVSPTTMTFTATATGVNTYNSYVTVTNPDGGAATSPNFNWVVVGQPKPTITSVSITGSTGTGSCRVNTDCRLTVTGTGFVAPPTIALSVLGSPFPASNVLFLNSTTITFTARPTSIGAYTLTVTETNPDGGTASATIAVTVTL